MEYKTIKTQNSDEFVEKRSRFIGYIKPVKTEEEAVAYIEEIRSKHWDATHNVYAYSLREGNIFRYSDDGEPQGTAGIPVLDVLRKSGITDAVVVVTRYFGGIMLGAGGLVRAYSHGASIAVAAGGPIVMRMYKLCSLECDYTQYGRLNSLVPENGGTIDDTQFTENVRIDFHMTEDRIEKFRRVLADATSGTVDIIINGEKFFADEVTD